MELAKEAVEALTTGDFGKAITNSVITNLKDQIVSAGAKAGSLTLVFDQGVEAGDPEIFVTFGIRPKE